MPKRPFIALIAALAGLAVLAGPHAAAPPPGASFVGSWRWQMDHPDFGGFSGLELAADGMSFIANTDRGVLAVGRLTRNAAGAVTGVAEAELLPLRTPDGRAVSGEEADPEGLAVGPDGRIHVSFEADHRVWSYAAPGAAAEPLPSHPDFAHLQPNSGLEALAIDADGRLLTLPERSGTWERPFPVYRWTGTEWEQPFALPRDGTYLPVGADFGVDGQLYLLERDFRGLLGFYSRISRFVIAADGPGPREVLFETRRPFQNNFEGIAVWLDATGRTRLTLLSDDNFARPLTTEFADYVVTP